MPRLTKLSRLLLVDLRASIFYGRGNDWAHSARMDTTIIDSEILFLSLASRSLPRSEVGLLDAPLNPNTTGPQKRETHILSKPRVQYKRHKV